MIDPKAQAVVRCDTCEGKGYELYNCLGHFVCVGREYRPKYVKRSCPTCGGSGWLGVFTYNDKPDGKLDYRSVSWAELPALALKASNDEVKLVPRRIE